MDETMRRSRPQIISEVLEICRTGANKTRIVYQANLNFRTINLYMQNLIKNRLLDVDQGIYLTTREGISLLESINQVTEKLSGYDKTEPVAVEE
jgi:predicted transcriptional regulator